MDKAIISENESAAASLIQAERARQIGKGFTPEFDDRHKMSELAIAASVLAMPVYWRTPDLLSRWPWEPDDPCQPPAKSDDELQNLVKAGALIHAEIGRLLRTRLPDFYEYSG